jgi:hypothetical protein
VLDRDNGNCLERMCDLIGSSEDRLVDRVIDAATTGALSRVPRSEDAWRDSIRGLSDAIFQAAYAVSDGYAEGPAHRDPVVAYGIVRARTHRTRGVHPADWIALLRHFRAAYLDLVHEAGFAEQDEAVCHRFIHRVFDRFEAGFRDGYADVVSLKGGTAVRSTEA